MGLDIAVFRFINSGFNTPLMDKLACSITFLGTGEFVFMLGALLLFFRRDKFIKCGIFLIAGTSLAYYVPHGIKEVVQRPRPYIALEDVHVLKEASGFSFPSSHATMSFLAAYILSRYFGKAYIFYVAAVLIALSRVDMGVHYPSDILAGAFLGYFLAKGLLAMGGASVNVVR